MIQVERLTKNYGRFEAIKDVSFKVDSGEIVGFLGPNGAGKTTTLRILTCFTPASAGKATVLGYDTASQSMEIRRNIGYLPEMAPLYPWMRVRGFLEFVARAKGLPPSSRHDEINKVMEAVGLSHVSRKIIRTLSKGYRQRTGLAQALLGDPKILILDEPTIGLDPKQIKEIRNLIKGFSQDRTVILSSHILPEVSQVCDRVIIINKGSIIAQDTTANLIGAHSKSAKHYVSFLGPAQEALSAIKGLEEVDDAQILESANNRVSILVESRADKSSGPAISRIIVEKGWDLLELTPKDMSLEDVFIELVTEEDIDASKAAQPQTSEVSA